MSCQMTSRFSEKGALSGEIRNDEKASRVRVCVGDASVVNTEVAAAGRGGAVDGVTDCTKSWVGA